MRAQTLPQCSLDACHQRPRQSLPPNAVAIPGTSVVLSISKDAAEYCNQTEPFSVRRDHLHPKYLHDSSLEKHFLSHLVPAFTRFQQHQSATKLLSARCAEKVRECMCWCWSGLCGGEGQRRRGEEGRGRGREGGGREALLCALPEPERCRASTTTVRTRQSYVMTLCQANTERVSQAPFRDDVSRCDPSRHHLHQNQQDIDATRRGQTSA